MLPIFEDRAERLRGLVDKLLHWTSKDYFIPSMLRHQKSANYVPGRIAEIFNDLYENEVSEFKESVQNGITQLEEGLAELDPLIKQYRMSGKRSLSRTQFFKSEMQQNYETLLAERNEIKQSSNATAKSILQQIQVINTEITELRNAIRKISIAVQAAEIQTQGSRSFINEIRKTQTFELQQAKRALTGKDWKSHLSTFVQSMRSNYSDLRIRNETQSDAITQIERMLGRGDVNETFPPRYLVDQAIQLATDPTRLDKIAIALNIPMGPEFASESLADKICALILFRIEQAKASSQTRRFRLCKLGSSA
jgi:hypothetical protein